VLGPHHAHYVDAHASGPVVELGAGHRAITNALIEHGVEQSRLVLVEYNPGFCALLRDRYRRQPWVQGDAYALRDALGKVLGRRRPRRWCRGCRWSPSRMLTRLKLIRDAFSALTGRALRAVHLFGDAADPEIVAGRFDRSLGTHLDEPSAGAGLGVSQGLTLPCGKRWGWGRSRTRHDNSCELTRGGPKHEPVKFW